jgi:GAF domain-containing protein
MILLDAKMLCNADGGTLYLRTGDPSHPGAGDRLKFEIMRTDSLNIALGGTTDQKITFEPLRLYDEATGAPNRHNIATHAALTADSINIPDAYEAEGFDFSGTRAFDQANGYRSKSFLTIPLKNHANHVIGVLQLINARDQKSGEVIAFDRTLQHLVESLSALATVALEAYIREQRLEAQLQELRILVDEAKKSTQVSEITETEYFRSLLEKVQVLRKKAQQGSR